MEEISKVSAVDAPVTQEVKVSLKDALPKIQSGDIFLFRCLPIKESLESAMIGAVTCSDYSHIEMAIWWKTRKNKFLCSVGMDEPEGGRAIGIEKHLARGRIVDVYSVKSKSSQRSIAVNSMLSLLSQEYNKQSISKVWRLLGFFRFITYFFHKHEIVASHDDTGNGHSGPKDCSEGVSWSWRRGGVDFIKNRADYATAPINISESPLTEYQFTLTL